MAHDSGGTKNGAWPTLPQGISTTVRPFSRASATVCSRLARSVFWVVRRITSLPPASTSTMS